MTEVKKPLPKFDNAAAKAARSNMTRSVKDKKRIKKNFSITEFANGEEGKKIILYSDSGMGKTSLAATLPSPVFICPDRGIQELVHPLGLTWPIVKDVDTWGDLRDVTQDLSLFKDKESVVFDTGTVAQNSLCTPWVVENIPKEKGGKARKIADYGYGGGYEHVFYEMLLWQSDLDGLVRAGKNVVILCQAAQSEIDKAGYGKYLQSHPDLFNNKKGPVMPSFVAWASYVLYIDWADIKIDDQKRAIASDERGVFTKPEMFFKAKSRGDVFEEYPLVQFENNADDTLWRIMFDGDTEDD
ncbi:MAG TPA: hypothetical protein ENH62_06800 [Marinobacter sp.]|uniref:Uncharacterized protein n=1 Tax=marine sediment metagenome TaxID=412755 RepID=A0A0F9STX7_9ZZZZ|nr:hypothetical protein [Marinobacter sp.]